MKTSIIIFVLVLTLPAVNAYSFTDFFEDTQEFVSGYISMTGAVISKITTKVSGLGSEDFEEIHPSNISTEHDAKLCRDTDELDYFKKGECISHTEKVVDYCSSDGKMVIEFHCGQNNQCMGEWYVCENRCVNGFCV